MCENNTSGVWDSTKDGEVLYKIANEFLLSKFMMFEYLVLCIVEHSVVKQDFYQWQRLLTVGDKRMEINHTCDTIVAI
jgi:hypothetical protein